MAFAPMHAFRITTRRVAWALLLGGGITLALGAGKEEAESYFDPLPKSDGRGSKARKKAEAGQPAARGPASQEPPAEPPPRGSRYAKLGDCGHSFADAAERALPSVVSVMSRTGSGRTMDGLGSGVVAGPRGHVLTSAHVVAGARSLRVRFHDGREADAVLVAADKASDVAVLRIRADGDAMGALAPIRFGDSEAIRVGEWVVAIGSPYGLSETVTTGIVSAKGRRQGGAGGYGGLIQTDAAINPGSSGGALVNLDGELVGLNTARVSKAGGSGIGFAVPSHLVRKVMDDLIRDGHVTRGWLGATVADAERPAGLAASSGAPRRGARVVGVARGGPADKAGMRRGDVITALDGSNVYGTDDLLGRVGAARPGSTLALEVWRSGKRMEMEVRLGRRATPAAARGGEGSPAGGEEHENPGPRLGMGVARADASLRKRFGLEKDDDGLLVVTSLDRDGGAEAAGIRVGDLILEADGREVEDADDLRRAATATARKSGDGSVTLRVRRDGKAFTAEVRVDPGPA